MANNELTIQSSLTSLPKSADRQESATGRSLAVTEQKANQTKVNQNELEKDVQNQQVQSQSLQSTVTQLNDHMQNLQRNLHFQVDENSGDTVIQVIDKETKEVVKQIPSEEILNARHAMEKYQGLLLEVKA